MQFAKSLLGLDGHRTFKPLRAHKLGSQQAALSALSRATLGSGDIAAAVKLPEGISLDEWLATHTLDSFNACSLLLGLLPEGSCTCPTMTAGPSHEYLWAEPTTQHGHGKLAKAVPLPATEYCSRLLDSISTQLADEALFPTSSNAPFPPSFRDDVRKTYRRLFRVFGHLYHSHLADIERAQAVAHMNSAYKHFLLFALEFKLIDAKELAPLAELNEALLHPAPPPASAPPTA